MIAASLTGAVELNKIKWNFLDVYRQIFMTSNDLKSLASVFDIVSDE